MRWLLGVSISIFFKKLLSKPRRNPKFLKKHPGRNQEWGIFEVSFHISKKNLVRNTEENPSSWKNFEGGCNQEWDISWVSTNFRKKNLFRNPEEIQFLKKVLRIFLKNVAIKNGYFSWEGRAISKKSIFSENPEKSPSSSKNCRGNSRTGHPAVSAELIF